MPGSSPLVLDRRAARRLCVHGQRLAGPRPASIAEAVHDLWMVQMDPTSAVARSEHLVLFSRLGPSFRVRELERMLWTERSLFEYWVHVLPTADLWVHRLSMRRYPTGGPRGTLKSRQKAAAWMAANASFRRYVLRELRVRGPLRARDLEDRIAPGHHSGGWTGDGRNVAGMLDELWNRGEVMIVGRDGQQRLWDLTERSLPTDQPNRSRRELTREIVERQLRARGLAKVGDFGVAFDGRPPGWERVLAELVKDGVAVPARVDGLDGEYFAHADLLGISWTPRTVLLSPFDDLVSHRDHTEALFEFFFRLEIYVPKAERRWGYFVLPILHGDRLIGRVDAKLDRGSGVLHLPAVHAEDGTGASHGAAARRAIDELARWLGAADVTYGEVPRDWRRALID